MRMLSTLPKGIVVNSPEISGDIERIDQQPVSQEDIAKLWKVYTTTKRKLRDPTAERLENYWWRIWGSRGRNLCGSTVARLFTDISDGHFTAPAWLINSKIAAQAKAQAKAQVEEIPTPQRNSSEAILVAAHAPKRNNENGSTRPHAPKKNLVMPHPILKKTRGPSAHGPRPTARFISPQETPRISPDASESEKEFFSAEDSPNDHVVVRPPTPEWRDTEEEENVSGAANGKGKRKPSAFAIAAARNKKRPSLLRRKSSQSSTNSDTITKGPVSKRAPTAKNLGGVLRHNVISQVRVKQAEDRSKTAIKQQDTVINGPTIVKNRTQSGRLKKQDPKGKASEASASSARPSQLGRAADNNEADPLTEEELHELNLQQTLLDEANARIKSTKKGAKEPKEHRTSEGFQVAHKSLRSKSTSDAGSTQNIAALALHPKNLKNPASVAPSHGAAIGTLELDDNPPNPEQLQKLDKGKGRAVDELQRIEANAELERGKDMFPKRLVQARPSSTSMIDLSAARGSDALSRSKSQLTLLLEKDRIRNNERAKAVGR